MKMPLNAAGFTPRSAKIAPMATSTLIGSDFFRGGEGFLNCARRLHMNATHAGFTREFEQACRAWIFGVQPMTKSRHTFGKADRSNACRKW